VRAALGTVVDPRAGRADHRRRLRPLGVGRGSAPSRCTCGCPPPSARQLRLADGLRRPRRGVRRPGGGVRGGRARRPPRLRPDQPRMAAGLGYRGTFGHEAEDSLDELRATFQRKAHTAAMERAVHRAAPHRPDGGRRGAHPRRPAGGGSTPTDALLRRRATLGLPVDDGAPVLVHDDGTRPDPAQAEMCCAGPARCASPSTGNAHFCRGLLTTRYPGSEADQTPRPEDRPQLPLTVSKGTTREGRPRARVPRRPHDRRHPEPTIQGPSTSSSRSAAPGSAAPTAHPRGPVGRPAEPTCPT
jgi:hypothetical protein